MKKKINRQFIVITTVAIVATLLLAIVVFYNLFRRQVLSDLSSYAHVLASSEKVQQSAVLREENLRVTIIDAKGNVLYDNYADADTMGNHGDRPEIKEALATGEGHDIRISDTEGKDTFYDAVRLENGTVLRVAREADNVWSIFFPVIPVIIAIAVVLLLICNILSSLLTRKLVQPIEKLALQSETDEEEVTGYYEELTPFINKIHEQHEAILENAHMRQEFTANVSHELKTPLTAISGYAELIETGMAREETVRFAGEIERNANRLLTLINDIIQLSELDTSEIQVEYTKVDMGELARHCVEMLQIKAQKHHVTLSYRGEQHFLMADREMMEELVYNLCDNAIRYNRENGKVEVTVLGEAHQLVLQVKDTGIGIPADQQERVFERFYRVDKSRSKSTGGTGLGLAIVKHIIARHDAQILMESKEGVGTTIRVVFQK